MKRQHEAGDGGPMDVRALWDMNGVSLDVAEKAYRAWLNGAGRIQNETLGFINERLEKGLEAARELGGCKSASEYFDVQAKYADRAMTDWIAQGEKMMRLIGELSTQTMKPLQAGVEEAAARTTARGRAAH